MLCRRCRVVGCRLGGSFAAIVIWAEAFAVVASSSADAWLPTAKLGWMLCRHIVADIGLMLCHHGCTLVGQYFV